MTKIIRIYNFISIALAYLCEHKLKTPYISIIIILFNFILIKFYEKKTGKKVFDNGTKEGKVIYIAFLCLLVGLILIFLITSIFIVL